MSKIYGTRLIGKIVPGIHFLAGLDTICFDSVNGSILRGSRDLHVVDALINREDVETVAVGAEGRLADQGRESEVRQRLRSSGVVEVHIAFAVFDEHPVTAG